MKMTITMTDIEASNHEAKFSLNDSEHVAYGSAFFRTTDVPSFFIDHAPDQDDFDRVSEVVDADDIEREVVVDFGPFSSKREYCEATMVWAESHKFNCDDVCQIMGECDGTTCKVYRGE